MSIIDSPSTQTSVVTGPAKAHIYIAGKSILKVKFSHAIKNVAFSSGHARMSSRIKSRIYLVKEIGRDTYFIKAYEEESRILVVSHIVHPRMEYRTPKSFFHSYSTTKSLMVGLHFFDTKEAHEFRNAVNAAINMTRSKLFKSIVVRSPVRPAPPTPSTPSERNIFSSKSPVRPTRSAPAPPLLTPSPTPVKRSDKISLPLGKPPKKPPRVFIYESLTMSKEEFIVTKKDFQLGT